jgi:hypothetical protein
MNKLHKLSMSKVQYANAKYNMLNMLILYETWISELQNFVEVLLS